MAPLHCDRPGSDASMLRPIIMNIWPPEPDAGWWVYRMFAGGVLDKVAGPFDTSGEAERASAEVASRC